MEDFKTAEEEERRKKLREWVKDARAKNLAPHNLGSRSYAGKEKVWAKEDAERKGPNPYDKIKDPKMSRFVRAHYKEDPKNKGDLILNAKVKKLEKAYLEEEEKEEMLRAESDAGSSAVTKNPYDTPFLRALNTTKGVKIDAKPNRSYVHGFEKGHRHADYYPDSKEKRKERKKVGESELKRALDNVNANMDAKVEQRVNAIASNVYADFGVWLTGA